MSDKWTSDLLEPMRLETDPIADRVVQDILAGGEEHEREVVSLFRRLTENDSPVPEGLPAVVKDYFETTSDLPPWADPEQIKRGEQVFRLYGPQIVLMLFCKSLPLCYSCWRGAQGLMRTGRLVEPPDRTFDAFNRRIMETAQFVLNVMSPDGLSPRGRGIRSAQKVRLIHAAIRYFIARGEWDMKKLGQPLNQEDLAGTLMSFSIVTLDGLARSHIPLSRQQQEDYLHAWKVVGHILGVRPELLPEDVDDARALIAAIVRRQSGASKAGKVLTGSLIKYMDRILLDSLCDHFPPFMMRYLLGDEMADMLAVKTSNSVLLNGLHRLMVKCLSIMERFTLHSFLLRKLTTRFSDQLLQSLVYVYNDYKKVYFFIPPSLRQGLESTRQGAIRLLDFARRRQNRMSGLCHMAAALTIFISALGFAAETDGITELDQLKQELLSDEENISQEEKEALLTLIQLAETDIAIKSQLLDADYSPGLVSLLRGEDLAARGVHTVAEALNLVPGLDIAIDNTGGATPIVRGIGGVLTTFSGKLKFMLNGVNANPTQTASNQAILAIPIEQVERIEIIRGPGSAIYGEYAYSGVINVITRKQGKRVFARYASFDTLSGGGVFSYASPQDLHLSLNVAGWKTNGGDVQAGEDALFGLSQGSVSNAPGPSNEAQDNLSAIFSLNYRGFSLLTQYSDLGRGDFFGIANNLPPTPKRVLSIPTALGWWRPSRIGP